MTALVWPGAFLIVAALGAACRANARYDREQYEPDQSTSCCPKCDVGGPGACGGAR